VGTVFEKNIISNIFASSASVGVRFDVVTCLQSQTNSTPTAANGTYSNNFVSTTGGPGSTDRIVYGILELSTGGTSTYAFNSINITGTASGANNTYGFNRSSTQTVSLRNNIFADSRTGGTAFHVAMANTNAAATGWNAAASNNNLLFNTTAANLTQWLGAAAANNQTLAGFQAASGGDAASLSGNPLFISASNLHLDPFGPTSPAENAGVTFGGIVDDIDGDTRASIPDIGADELRCHAGVDVSCDDGSACTNDSCNPATGCVNSPGNGGTECRPSAGGCDVAETCDGVSAACPADVLVAGGTECRASLGACDPAESCSGVSALCPGDALYPAGTECRPSSGAACDPAEVCTGSDVTCPKDTVNANAPLGPTVTLSKSGGATVISWTEIEPGPFNVYRGFRDVGVAFTYNQTCFDPEVAGSSSSDSTIPPTTRTFFYLISRVAPPCTESTLGEDSAGNDRPNPASCPAFAPDNDQDTVEDAFDNCPFSINPTQLDTDRDGRGDACDPCPEGEGCDLP